MRSMVLPIVILCSACQSISEPGRSATSPASDSAASATRAGTPPTAERAAADAAAIESLGDLRAMTFRCPQAGLNAAAREAAKAPTQGRYQFAYYRLINDSHHSSYEVHFKSNVQGEADLKYCVSVYCQQGQDPNAGVSVSLMSTEPRPTKAGAPRALHSTDCGVEQMRAKYGGKRSVRK